VKGDSGGGGGDVGGGGGGGGGAGDYVSNEEALQGPGKDTLTRTDPSSHAV